MRASMLMSLMLIFLTSDVSAREEEQLNRQDYMWRTVFGDGSFSSSPCLGETSTPSCAIDSLITCSAWTRENPRYGEAGQLPYLQPDICRELDIQIDSPGFWPSGYTPRSTWVWHYYTDTWIERAEERPSPVAKKLSGKSAEAALLVVDVFVMVCTPQSDCVERIGEHRSADEILALCPRTSCHGAPRLDRTTSAIKPNYQMFFRRSADRWQFDEYLELWLPPASRIDFDHERWHRRHEP